MYSGEYNVFDGILSITSIPKVAGLIPTVVRLTFQPARCGYTLTITSNKVLKQD
jgi:hypothetical protein